ncbi:Gfo/Idh/MocA family oxidoreductase [Pseudoclavibacter sp. CFCC 14310]|uniref:Gfo/Idh/MocA family protein n=1 Tax=Pseudoclavibacter sp. CFCC 14310 TaxID=2615180 RepID=UPI001301707D|nr:Gfo/Idh/MocA family oxidoreductase [Pseudoclavibacter sp. CFCC 14310]KAB1644326.1 Gfo/Idh/MocA family oxidoreductase [Pseudoclavibacter sp. CFCC 14310]
MSAKPLRIGSIGAARITVTAVSDPAQETGDALVAVAARDPERARAYADTHGWQDVAATYDELLARPDVDLVYIGLPNALHAQWAVRALKAGKSVLLEKPFAANLDEFDQVAEVLRDSSGWLWEAWHYRFHPLFGDLLAQVGAGRLGRVTGLDVHMHMPEPAEDDPRWSFDLAGGALMDVGCYALHASQRLAEALGQGLDSDGLAHGRVRRASADVWRLDPRVDQRVTAELSFGELPVHIEASMADDVLNAGGGEHGDGFDFSITVHGERGTARVPRFLMPEVDDRVIITDDAGEHITHAGTRHTYAYQLDTVRAEHAANRRDGDELARSREVMRLIDEVYRATGLPLRAGALDTASA